MTSERCVTRGKLYEQCRGMGKQMLDSLPDGVGFTLLVFDYASYFVGRGESAYISSATSDDMLRTMRDAIRWLEGPACVCGTGSDDPEYHLLGCPRGQ